MVEIFTQRNAVERGGRRREDHHVLSQSAGGATVDPDHPWLGLHPFTEENQHYFFGRTAEIRDIFLRVRENPLTALYGQSGLGKTSLLRAGLIPKLRVERFRPVHLLLDFSSASPSLVDQVREALAKICVDPDSDTAAVLERWGSLHSLWEIYTHEKLRPAELAARPPVLIFDQFEEVFTLGRNETGAPDTREGEVAELFTQIADLVENRAPAAVQALFQNEPQRARDYEFGPTFARVVLALREDFLAQFEQWKSAMPSLMRNRMPLRLLSGPQALEAVVRPGRIDGRSLVSDQVGRAIVRFVAQRPVDTPLEEIEAVPPLISLVCERLNAARFEAKPPQQEISDELVKSQGPDILQRFYDESFAAFPDAEREAVREYIEDRMVTVGGHRNPVAREDAVAELARRGVPAPDSVLNALIARRLLTPEQRGGIQRLEITHDVLAPLVVRGRKEREERRLTKEAERRTEEAKQKQAEAEALAANERRRRRRLGIALVCVSVLLLVAVGALFYAFQQKSRADTQLSRAQIEEGRAWIERAKLNSTRGNRFAAALMAARAVGFAGYGREKIADSKFNEEYPVLLNTVGDPIDEQEARQQINEATSAGYFGLLLWQSPVFEQDGGVSSVAWSPDGKILASGSDDKTIKLWEAASGKLLSTLEGHTYQVYSVAWSPDGKTLASGSYDQTVKLWEAASGKLLATLQGNTQGVNSVAWSPDGKTLASGSWDDTVKLWEAASGKLLASWEGHNGYVRSVAWSPDGKTLASGSADNTVKLWEAASGKLLATLQGHTNWIDSVAWSPDGKTLASGSGDKTIKVWEAASGKLLSTLQTDPVGSVAWSPDGKTLASGSYRTVNLWEAASGKLLASWEGHTDQVNSVAWSPDGKILASGSLDGRVKLWEAAPSSKPLATLQGDTDSVCDPVWSPDGKILASASGDKTIKLWEAASGKLLSTLEGHTDQVDSVAWSPDGKTLASGSHDQTVKLWEAASGKLLATLQGHTDSTYSVAWSPDGKTLASGSADNTVKLWEAASGKLLATLQGHTRSIYGRNNAAWSPDGKTLALASGSDDETVKLWEAASGKLLATLQGHTAPIESAAWSPDGKTLASGSADNTVKLWEAASGKLLATLHHTDQVNSVAWSPDGKTLASGSGDKTIKLWEAASGKLLATLQGSFNSVAWSPDGKTLASGSADNTVKLWEAASGKLLATLQVHTASIDSVAWSPDGKTLALFFSDHTVELWEAPSVFEIDLAEYLRSRWIRLVASEVDWKPNGHLLRDQSFQVVNLRGATLLSIERSGLSGSQKLREQLSLLLRAGNLPEAVAIWKATPAEAADPAIRRLLLADLSVSASDDLLSNTSWRALWLTEQIQAIITPEAMLDPAVSLGMLRLGTRLTLAGSAETKVASVSESFSVRLTGLAPRFWFVALGQNLLAAATETNATKQQREAVLAELRRLTNQMPDSPELQHLLAEALSKLH
jgi:WD40 repeat protein